MTNLSTVVKELQEQNKTLAGVQDSIRAMLAEDINRRKAEERAAGNLEEDRRERKNKERKTTSAGAPKGFGEGLAQGSGMAAARDTLKGFMGSIGFGLGGATLGGLFGKAIGRLFFPALGAFFGVQYLDKWVDPLVDKITGDDAAWTLFGQQVDASKIIAGLAGGLAVIFSKDLIIQAVRGVLGVGDETKAGNLRKTFVRRLGLGLVLNYAGNALGDAIAGFTGSEQLGDAISRTAEWASFGLMFGPTGAIVMALAAVAYSGALFVKDWLDKKRDTMKRDLDTQFQKYGDDYDKAVNEIDAKFAAEAQINSLRQKYAINETMSAEDVGKLNDVISRIEADYGPESAQRLKALAASLTVAKGPDQRGQTDNELSADGIAVLKGYMAENSQYMTGWAPDQIQDELRRTLAYAGIIDTAEQNRIIAQSGLLDSLAARIEPPRTDKPLSHYLSASSATVDGAGSNMIVKGAQFGASGEILREVNAAAALMLAGMKAGGITINHIDQSKSTTAVSKSDRVVNAQIPSAVDMNELRRMHHGGYSMSGKNYQ